MEWWTGGPLGPGGVLEWTASETTILWVVVVALVAWTAAIPGERPILPRLVEVLSWGLAVAGLAMALCGPVWVEQSERTERGRVAVLIDGSRSMGIIEDGHPRSDQVAPILAHVRETMGPVELFHFGDDLSVGEPSAYTAPGTDIEGALEALSERVAGEQLAAVVLVTDGLDRGLLRRRYQVDGGALPPQVPGPLTVFQVGTPGRVTDLSVRSVESGGYAFIRSPFRFRATLEGLGFEGQTVNATLELDGATVTTRPVRLDDQGRGEVEFEVIPEDAGRFTYAVRVPLFEGDAVPANNVMPMVVRVVRDRIRVLQVAGSPSWDVKFLRRFLKGDPSVQLVSFFILRTTGDLVTAYRDEELSLIQFPYRRLFDEDLWSFDVVIFQNFDYRPYFGMESALLLGNLARYVEEEGGALVMVGGDRSFSMGEYGASPLADVLPVRLPEVNAPPSSESFEPVLTQEGARHPLTRLAADPEENAQWWDRLHPLDGTNQVLGEASGATVLLAHPTLKGSDGHPLPVLAVREVGAGRTMALTVDSSWRWSLSEAAQGRGNQAYLRFWKNSIRWLMRDSTTARVVVDTPRENYAVGDEVRVVVRARDAGFAPLVDAPVAVRVSAPDVTLTLEGRTGTDGDVVLTLPATHRGTHRVTVEVGSGATAVGAADTVFAVTSRDPELDEVAPASEFLEWLAQRTGGTRHPPGRLGVVTRDAAAGRLVRERRETALWRAPALVLWILALAGLAWNVRRRSGMR